MEFVKLQTVDDLLLASGVGGGITSPCHERKDTITQCSVWHQLMQQASHCGLGNTAPNAFLHAFGKTP